MWKCWHTVYAQAPILCVYFAPKIQGLCIIVAGIKRTVFISNLIKDNAMKIENVINTKDFL